MKTIKDVKDIKLMQPTSAMMSTRKGAWGGVFSLIVPALMLTGLGTVGYGAYQYFVGDDSGDSGDQQLEFTSTKQTTPDGQEVETPGMDASQCGDGMKTVFDAVAVNPLDDDGTPTYQNVTLYLQDKEKTGALRTYQTTGTSSFAANSLELACPQEYTVYVPAKQNKTASMKMPLTADRAVENIQPEIPSTDFLKIKGYDELNRGFVHNSDDSDATDYEDMENGKVTFTSTTNNTTAYDMGVGDDLDMTFRVKTDSQKQWGDLDNYIVVDADTSDFSEPSLYMGGTPLKEVGKSGLPHVDDQGYVSGYEYVFKVPDDIGSQAKEIRLATSSKDSIDPDVDIKMRFLVNSISMDGTSARESIFKSDGSEVAYSSAQTVTIDIA